MRKKLTDDLELIYQQFYPYNRKKPCFHKKNRILVSIGGNIGNTKQRFKNFFLTIQKDKKIDVISTSPILKNPPFGFKNQDDFFNAVVSLKTNMNVNIFFKYIMNLEKIFRRKRSFTNAPRTLDIDIIFFNNIEICNKKLIIPHKEWKNRESVIIPMILLKGER